MKQIYPDGSLLNIIARILAGDVKIKLFSNNHTVSRSSVLGDFTEATFTGYSAAAVSAASFSTTGVAAHVGTAIAAAVSFTVSSGGPASCYGYFMTDSAGSNLIAAANFDSPPVVKNDGESFSVIPIIGDVSNTF